MSQGPSRDLRKVAYTRQQLERLSRSRSLTPHELLQEVANFVDGVVPHVAPFWTTLDPESLLPTGALETDKPRDVVRALWRNELMDDDVNGITDLYRRAVPVGALSELHPATLAKSPRVQLIHRPAGIGDELRFLLRADGLVWGKGALHISPHTLHDHIESVFHKLDVTHRAELMALVAQYVTPDGRPVLT